MDGQMEAAMQASMEAFEEERAFHEVLRRTSLDAQVPRGREVRQASPEGRVRMTTEIQVEAVLQASLEAFEEEKAYHDVLRKSALDVPIPRGHEGHEASPHRRERLSTDAQIEAAIQASALDARVPRSWEGSEASPHRRERLSTDSEVKAAIQASLEEHRAGEARRQRQVQPHAAVSQGYAAQALSDELDASQGQQHLSSEDALQEALARSMDASQQHINFKPAKKASVMTLPRRQVTSEELGKLLEEKKQAKGNEFDKQDQLDCKICLSEYEAGDEQRILPCMHKFHKTCADRWLLTSGECPMCKHRVDA
eukprot:TRINITY_DN61938_c0_g1_i1.p1 TRINITY_DN61938_c0_g1~~TRINITY_DN61938_c0_g1_i1.p1  ORF type:complete len:311 (+),score=70.14 TRINITY_DN61938_c0_g1_i1:93-1025(+)